MADGKYGTSEVLLGLHKLIVFKYDYARVRQFVEKYLMRCSATPGRKSLKRSACSANGSLKAIGPIRNEQSCGLKTCSVCLKFGLVYFPPTVNS